MKCCSVTTNRCWEDVMTIEQFVDNLKSVAAFLAFYCYGEQEVYRVMDIFFHR